MATADVHVDLAATRRRRARLERYVARHLLDESGFLCPHLDACRGSVGPTHQFRPGIMSHVGRRFDMQVDDKALRVIVVGQEAGLPKVPNRGLGQGVTLRSRYRHVHDGAGVDRRYYAEPGFPGRNPHMRGTTTVLRLIAGHKPGVDYDGEFLHPVNGRPFHLYDGFALVNRLLCSAGVMNTSQGRPTATMFDNCTEHFRATMRILEPTLVVLQGKSVTKWTAPVLQPGRTHGEHLYEADLEGRRVLVCTFSHPSARGDQRWGDRPDSPYVRQVIAPTIRKALRRL